MNEPRAVEPVPGERVPLFGTWRWAYAIVLAVLAFNILLLYAWTRLLS